MKREATAAFLGAAIVFAGAASATPIAINNYNFEDPPIGDGAATNGTVSGWASAGGEIRTVHVTGWIVGTDGPRFMQARTSNAGAYQILGTNLAPDTTYTLEVDVGTAGGFAYGGYNVELRSGNAYLGSSLLASEIDAPDGNNEPGAGQWLPVTVTFTTGPVVTAAPLIIGLHDLVNLSASQSTVFDNVRLNAVVPEPGTLALATLGGLWALTRRRSR